MSVENLFSRAVEEEGAVPLDSGALSVTTGAYTGRCPGAKFFVCDLGGDADSKIDWSNNQKISAEAFLQMKDKVLSYLKKRNPVTIKSLERGAMESILFRLV